VSSSNPDPADPVDPLLMRAKGRLGQVLKDKWRLDVLLGVGGMASVYAATHRNGSRAAIKLLHPELSLHLDVRTRFQREGYIANAVGHDGAVKVIDDDVTDDGAFFLVTELLDGETLEDRRLRAGGRLAEDEVLRIIDQLLEVLVAAHGKGVVHRDLKPDNVFVTRDGRIKVLDFGIARLRETTGATTTRTSDGTMGTPAFMAPEQARGVWDEVDGRADLWAVGATMFNLLTGALVHPARSPNEQLLFAMTREARRLGQVAPSSAPGVRDVVDRALAFARDRRWPDAAQMQQAVRRAYGELRGEAIAAAAPLDVPSSVGNRTLPRTPGEPAGPMATGLPTTARPVATAPATPILGATTDRRRPVARTMAAVVAAGAAVAVVIGVLALASSGISVGTGAHGVVPSAPPSSAAAPALASASTSTTAVATTGAPPSPPEIAATDLPLAPALAPVLPVGRPSGTGASRTVVPPVAPSGAPSAGASSPTVPAGCKPPYTIDPTSGKKHFKVECL
jgi:eukaryotic-like serine/threonine-protein kinase